ncbi:MAG: EAL domain-containing protein [Lachnospiraceae bacterium]|nr:EAL domain-containing protein [Lachnospiraceae bacterium]
MIVNLYVTQIARVGFQTAAFFVCLTLLYMTAIHIKGKKLQSHLFMAILINILVTAFCDVMYSLALPYLDTSQTARYVYAIFIYIYFVFHFVLAPMFFLYVAYVTGAVHYLRGAWEKFYFAPMIISALLALTNPLTEWVYYFDESFTFHRNWAEYVVYVIAAIYLIVAFVLLLFIWQSINMKKRRALALLIFLLISGTVLQMVYIDLQVELFFESMAMLVLMITVENEDERRDIKNGGIYNQVALMEDLNSIISARLEYSMICIKGVDVSNPIIVNDPLNIMELTGMTTAYLRTLVPTYQIYYLNPGIFVVLQEIKKGKGHLDLAKQINKRFNEPWTFQGRNTVFATAVLYAELPKEFKTTEEILAVISSPGAFLAKRPKEVICGQDLNFLLRMGRLDKVLLEGIKNNNYEVYYQPIYDAGNMSVCAAEALIRLHSSEIGDVYPDEILPIAERNGLIFDITDFVIEEVCRFLSSGIPMEMGVSTININLSVVQCLQENYADRLIGVISKFDVDPSKIDFEISETATTANFLGLKAFIKKLRDFGCRFSVDDYGIGYSNAHSVFSLDVDSIKIDRSMLWDAEEEEVGGIIFESSINMFRHLGKKIQVAGVETKQQVDYAIGFGVDYLQGFYFSNPISQREFIAILKGTQLARQEEQRALAANEAMSGFLANMSHEIRTPINAVLGMDEMILRECDDERIVGYARTIEGAGRSLLSLINDILDFTKIEAGSIDIVEGEYELATVIGDVVDMVEVKATNKDLRLLVNVDSNLPEKLYGDEMRIRQIMINVLNNAIKYTNKGSVSMRLEGRTRGTDEEILVFTVKDTGIGIRPEDKDKLFHKFQRLDLDKNKTVEGNGLGLAIVKNLIDYMGGTIQVESAYGEGSTFILEMPQRIVSRVGIGDYRKKIKKNYAKQEKYHEIFQAPDASILVVDDTPINHFVIKELLKRTQLSIDTADSGAECLEKARQKQYDVIFLDYRMPQMDGIETLERMKEDPETMNAETPVIALTANAISGSKERFLQAGFDDYITKPVDSKRLEEVLLMYLPFDRISEIGEQKTMEKEEDNLDKEKSYGLDVAKGISNCGSRETYRVVFNSFRGDIPTRTENIGKAYEEKDWKSYGLEVHTIKSSARLLGAGELSDLAEKLEHAADAGDVEFIDAETEHFLSIYTRLQDIKQKDGDTERQRGKAELTPRLRRDAYETLFNFAEQMDYDNVMQVLEELDGYDLSEEEIERCDTVRDMSEKLRWDDLKEILREWLREDSDG